jgi:tetraacyldisaccharide 4'-kinase
MTGWMDAILNPYAMAAAARRAAYRRSWLSSRRLRQPVISIGNLSVGGSGKTPLVAWVAAMLVERGLKPSILTRGYRRGSQAGLIIIAPGENRRPDSLEAGDEPALLARRLPSVPILVAADRWQAGCAAEREFGVDAHVLDDGFQHLRLHRDLDVVALDSSTGLERARVLPFGPLREPVTALRSAQAAVITRCEVGSPEAIEALVKSINPGLAIFRAATILRHLAPFAGSAPADIEDVRRLPSLAFCAIGNPRAFWSDLRQWGFNVAGERAFRDHHRYTAHDLAALGESAVRCGARQLLTTEKDFQNLPRDWRPGLGVYACSIDAHLEKPGDFTAFLLNSLAQN